MFQIAVPSYKRSELFAKNTYQVLKRHNLLDVSTLFINSEDEQAYKDFEIRKVVRDCQSLVERRDYIYSYFPEDTWIIQIDDDISGVIGEDRKEVPSLRALIERGCSTSKTENCRLWGVYPVANPFFFTEGHDTCLRYICACLYGVLKTGEYVCAPTEGKHDIWWSCWYFKKDGKVLRLNDVSAKANYYTAKGGRSDERRKEIELEGAQRVCADFPEYAKLYTRKRTGYAELRLKNIKPL